MAVAAVPATTRNAATRRTISRDANTSRSHHQHHPCLQRMVMTMMKGRRLPPATGPQSSSSSPNLPAGRRCGCSCRGIFDSIWLLQMPKHRTNHTNESFLFVWFWFLENIVASEASEYDPFTHTIQGSSWFRRICFSLASLRRHMYVLYWLCRG